MCAGLSCGAALIKQSHTFQVRSGHHVLNRQVSIECTALSGHSADGLHRHLRGARGGGWIIWPFQSISWQLCMRQSALMELACLTGSCWLLNTGQQALPAVLHCWYACCFFQCPTLPCPALSCPDSAWSCPALSCPVSAWSCPALSCPGSNCADVLPCYQLYTDIAGVQHNRTLPLQIFLLRQTVFSLTIISNSISKRFKASAVVLYDYDNTYSCR